MNAHSENAPPARNEDSVVLHLITFAAVGLAIAALGLGVESRWLLLILVLIAAEGYLLSVLLRRSNSPIWSVGPLVPAGGIVLLLALAFEDTVDENRLLFAVLSLAISGFLAVSRRSLYSSLLLSGVALGVASRHHDEAAIFTGIYVVLVLAFLARATSIDATRGAAGQTSWRRRSRVMALVVHCGVIAGLAAAFFWVLPWEGEQANAPVASTVADTASSASGPPSQLITPPAEPSPEPEAEEAQRESELDKSVDVPPPRDIPESERPSSAALDPASTHVANIDPRTEPSTADQPQGGETAVVQSGTPVSPSGAGSWRAGDYIREGLSDTVRADGLDTRIVVSAGVLIALALAATALVWRRRSMTGQPDPTAGQPADGERLEIVEAYRRLEVQLSTEGFGACGTAETPARYLVRIASQVPEAVADDLRKLAATVSQAAYGPTLQADAAAEASQISLHVESTLKSE